MRKSLIRILQAVVLVAVASSFANADNFMYFKKKATAAAGGTNYCSDASTQLCLYMNGNNTSETDHSANAYIFVQVSGAVPTDNNTPTGYLGVSRDFELNDIDGLSCANAACPDLNINGADAAVSLTAWIKPESATNTVQQYIVSKYNGTGDQRQYIMMLTGTGTNLYNIKCLMSPDGITASSTISDNTSYATGTWKHLACVSNDTDIRLYVDGSLHSTPTGHTTGLHNGTANIYVGTAGSSTGEFDGLIDEVVILSRGMSAAEVMDITTNGITGNKGGSD